MSLNESMQIVESTIAIWKLVNGPIGNVVKKKIHAVTEKNSKLYWFSINQWHNEWQTPF
jgi:hypothetical protein